MEFKSNKPIYQQIVDFCFNAVLSSEWRPSSRVPSVRELASQLAVNSHTVLKAFEYLQDSGIIYPKRGLGYFLADDARERVDALRREEFYQTTLLDLFAEMDRLGITIDYVAERYRSR